jgi:hypothetical protein
MTLMILKDRMRVIVPRQSHLQQGQITMMAVREHYKYQKMRGRISRAERT